MFGDGDKATFLLGEMEVLPVTEVTGAGAGADFGEEEAEEEVEDEEVEEEVEEEEVGALAVELACCRFAACWNIAMIVCCPDFAVEVGATEGFVKVLFVGEIDCGGGGGDKGDFTTVSNGRKISLEILETSGSVLKSEAEVDVWLLFWGRMGS